MSGSDALAGYRYQLQRTLEYVFDEFQADDTGSWQVFVESRSRPGVDGEDTDIIDFSIDSEFAGRSVVAQVKGGRPGSTIGAADVANCIFRLAQSPGDAERRILLTNRQALVNADDLLSELANAKPVETEIRQVFRDALRAAPRQLETLKKLSSEQLLRCKDIEVRFDKREFGEVDEALRSRTRQLRASFGTRIGWTGAGLLCSALLQQLLSQATERVGTGLTAGYLADVMKIDASAIYSSILVRDWGNVFGRPALPGDVARPSELNDLRAVLDNVPRGRTPAACKISGPSGIGKSSLAAAYILEYGDCFERVYWIEAADSSTLQNQIAHALGLGAESTALPKQELVARFHHTLSNSAEDWLLVLDNAMDRTIVETWIPTFGSGQVIVTTIDASVVVPGSTISVGAMSDEESIGLLANRFEGDDSLNGKERERALGELAAGLDGWPLALEIASKYMVSCGILLSNVNDYLGRLRIRSLDDKLSVPFSYPRTLVEAIRLSIAKMRDDGDVSSLLAQDVLVNASYLMPRQVPVNLLLQASILDPRAAVEVDLHIPAEYTGSPPFEEITRALHRYSLCRRDDVLLIPSTSRAAPSAPVVRYTINVNEVVQEVVRLDTWNSGRTEDVVGNLAFFLQQWVAYFRDLDVDILQIEGHAASLAFYAISNGLNNYNVALLCGNTAVRLADRGRFDEAKALYKAEIDCLSRRDEISTLWVQALVGLSMVTIQAADRIDLAASEIVSLLGRALPAVSQVADDQTEQLAEAVQSASQVLSHPAVKDSCPRESLELLRLAEALATALPTRSRFDPTSVSATANELLSAGEYEKVLSLIEDCVLGSPNMARRVRKQLQRYVAEASVGLMRWESATAAINQLCEALQDGVLDYRTSAVAFINVSFGAVAGMQAREHRALALYRSCERLARIHIEKLGPFRPTDEARRLVLVVWAADCRGDSHTATETLAVVRRVDLESISDSDRKSWLALYDILHDRYMSGR